MRSLSPLRGLFIQSPTAQAQRHLQGIRVMMSLPSLQGRRMWNAASAVLKSVTSYVGGVKAGGFSKQHHLDLLLFYGYTVESQSKKNYGRAGEVADPGKDLFNKHGVLNSRPQDSCQKLYPAACTCNSIARESETGGFPQLLGWPTQLVSELQIQCETLFDHTGGRGRLVFMSLRPP